MRRKLLILAAVLSTALATALPVGAAAGGNKPSTAKAPYVVIMESAPAVGYDGGIAGLPATKPGQGGKINPKSAHVRKYVGHLEDEKAASLDGAGASSSAVVSSYNYAVNGYTAMLTESEAKALTAQEGVMSVSKDYLRQLHTDASPDFLGLTDSGGAWDTGYDGDGVVVGVIDSGIWPEHPSFADDGSYATAITGLPCDFGNTAYNPNDYEFECNDKLIGARNMRTLYDSLIPGEPYHSARDYDGHGTHTASTAAGNADVAAAIFGIDRGTASGVAPRAQIVAYSACGELGCFGGDLADAIDQAVADGVDVINYSIGSNAPGLNGPDDIAFLFAADAGVFVATSNGNNGPDASTIGSPATVPWITSVGANTHDRDFTGSVELGDSEYFGASVTPSLGDTEFADAADHQNELCDPSVRFRPSIEGKIVICLRGGFARVAKSQAVYEQGGAGMVLYNSSDSQSLVTDSHWVPSVHVSYSDGLALLTDYQDAKSGQANQNGNGKAENKAIGNEILGSINGGVAVAGPGSVMADFSSRGPVGSPASADIIKPDVTAPGVNILAGNTPTPTLGAPGELFQSISGTSMSSPHVAGLFALLKQANPSWTPAQAKSALMTTARQDVVKEDGSTAADPFDMGAGHVDPSGDVTAANSIFNPGLVYDAGLFEYAAFSCGTDAGIFTPGSCAFLESIGVPSEGYNLNLPSIGVSSVPGTITVTRTVTNVSASTVNVAASVEDPAGYTVTVDPSNLSLASGASATFEVTIDNNSAPAGDWRFGSLTWVGDGYSVRSPIAVNGAQLAAPESIAGTGANGSASFDIGFGYTGDYTAAAHGLVPSSPISGTVTQDPDQEFDPSDVGNGATAHEIVLSGAAFLRITLDTADLTPADTAIDLDLFLHDSAGNEVGASGAGSTAELIELVLPGDDTYTLYVHGWQTTGIEVAYNLQTWDVSATPGGSLVVDSAPASATIGTTGTVDVSWSGVGLGNYLGAVSHSDSGGVIELTLVEIAN